MVLPVEISDLKKHLNIDINDDDDLLLEYEAAAVELAEHFMCREIIQRKDPQALSTTAAGFRRRLSSISGVRSGIFTNSAKLQQLGSLQRFTGIY